MNAENIEKEFEEKQISKKELFLKKLDKGDQIKRNCITHEVLNLQKIEVALAHQKNYMEAQSTRSQWQKMIKDNYEKLNEKNENERQKRLEEFERS